MSSGPRSYTYRPQKALDSRGKSYTLHREARRVTSVTRETNAAFSDVARILRQTRPAVPGKVPLTTSARTDPDHPGVPADWAPWLGQKLAAGAYGVAFKTRHEGQLVEQLKRARQSAAFLYDHTPVPAGAPLIIKVARDYDDGGRPSPLDRVTPSGEDFAMSSVKEASWHGFLKRAPCIRVPGVSSSTCPSAGVPAIYWAGMVVDQITSRRFYITVMAVAPGIPVSVYMDGQKKKDPRTGRWALVKPPTGPLTAAMYLAIERAVALMWLNGVVHADFHRGNMLWDAASGKATIIDFGQGVGLSPAMTEQLRQKIAPAIADGVRSLGELWKSSSSSQYGLGLQAFTNRVRSTRAGPGGIPWYNPDGHALMQLYGALSPADRQAVIAKRRALWGVAAPPKAPGSPTSVLNTRAGTGRASGGRASGSRASTLSPRRVSTGRLRVALAGAARAAVANKLSGGGPVPMNINYTGPVPMDIDGGRRRAAGRSKAVFKARTPAQACRERGLRFDIRRRACVV